MTTVSVQLTTSTPFVLPDTQYVLPALFGRFQLSTLLNKVLSLPSTVPFDFLIDGALLRGSISDYLAENKKSIEDILKIEYIQSTLPPSLSSNYESDDWISSVHISPRTSAPAPSILTGNYDHAIRIYSTAPTASPSTAQHTLFGHSGPVSGVTWINPSQLIDVPSAFASCSHDRTARLWAFSESSSFPESNNAPTTYSILTLHTDQIHSISASQSGAFVLTASSDTNIGVFSTKQPLSHEVDPVDPLLLDGKKKRRKIADLADAAKRKAPEQVLTNHTGRVSKAAFCNGPESAAYSAGWDNTVRTWDVESGVNDTTKQSSSVVRDITSLASSQLLLATGHADRLINIWDIRSEVHNISLTLPAAHKSHITALSAHPTSQHHLASASLDGTVKMWDLRSSKAPLFDLIDENGGEKSGRLLGMHWDGEIIATGGEDRKLRIWKGRINV